MPPDRRPSFAGSISSPTGGHYAADAAPSSLHSNGAGGQEDDHSASPSAEPEGSKGKRKHTRGIGRGRVSSPCPSALCKKANLDSPVARPASLAANAKSSTFKRAPSQRVQ